MVRYHERPDAIVADRSVGIFTAEYTCRSAGELEHRRWPTRSGGAAQRTSPPDVM